MRRLNSFILAVAALCWLTDASGVDIFYADERFEMSGVTTTTLMNIPQRLARLFGELLSLPL